MRNEQLKSEILKSSLIISKVTKYIKIYFPIICKTSTLKTAKHCRKTDFRDLNKRRDVLYS